MRFLLVSMGTSNFPLCSYAIVWVVDVVGSVLSISRCRNSKLWTPLDCAAHTGCVGVITELIEAEAPLNPKDKSSVSGLCVGPPVLQTYIYVRILYACSSHVLYRTVRPHLSAPQISSSLTFCCLSKQTCTNPPYTVLLLPQLSSSLA